ncbi:MAG: hypothetical protein IPI90_08310 [Saprospiraceae bacterium]|nr:hypothetical protein [Candidatus Vicinibacter affinis]
MFEYIQRMMLMFAFMQPLIAYTQDHYLKGKVLALPVKGISAVVMKNFRQTFCFCYDAL